MDHPGERIGHWMGDSTEAAGKSVDKLISDSGGVTTWGGNPVLSVGTFLPRIGITLGGRGYDALISD